MAEIMCSNCGATGKISPWMPSLFRAVDDGWGSYGSALYCPKCTSTWEERNGKDRPMADERNTFRVMSEFLRRAADGGDGDG